VGLKWDDPRQQKSSRSAHAGFQLSSIPIFLYSVSQFFDILSKIMQKPEIIIKNCHVMLRQAIFAWRFLLVNSVSYQNKDMVAQILL
jgi:hypothetical protein